MRAYRWGFSVGVLAVALAVGPGVPAVGAGASPSLTVTPSSGPAGTRVHIVAAGLPSGAHVTFVWQTANGTYRTKVEPTMISFYGYAYEQAQAELGRAAADSQGRVVASFPAPEDIGGPHQIFAVVEGHPVAQGQFQINFSAAMTPLSGPVGTPIEITFHGLGPAPWNTESLSYDNHYTGFISAITTHGGGHFSIRAAGAAGPHDIELNTAANATPMLNAQQGPGLNTRHLNFKQVWTFTVTRDTALPATRLEWPASGRVVKGAPAAPGATLLAAAPASGPVLSRVEVHAKGLTPRAQAQVMWQTMGPGNRLTGMSPLETHPLFAAAAAPDGTLNGAFTVPDDLGGRHTIEVVQNARVVASALFVTTPSFVAVTPTRVKAGQQFSVEIKGVGWTEIDNAVAVTYDNAYMGYACGFNSRGDVTIYFRATGGPGVHLIDLYPMMYQGGGEPPWTYQVPQLTTLEDGPGLGLGFGLPIFRTAVMVVP
ncbi:MAG TPA: hypothetical protein VEP50_16355 [bacterium]|nr:hypothetical protein [bacterium]